MIGSLQDDVTIGAVLKMHLGSLHLGVGVVASMLPIQRDVPAPLYLSSFFSLIPDHRPNSQLFIINWIFPNFVTSYCQSRLQEALKLVGMLLFPLKWFLIVISLTFKREVSSQV